MKQGSKSNLNVITMSGTVEIREEFDRFLLFMFSNKCLLLIIDVKNLEIFKKKKNFNTSYFMKNIKNKGAFSSELLIQLKYCKYFDEKIKIYISL